MIITIPTKDIGEGKPIYQKSLGFKWRLEDGIEKWIKRELGLENE